jgi:hypothetical protein
MKVEFLDDISGDGHYPSADPNRLIRLYDFDLEEALKFRDAIQTKLLDHGESLKLANESYIAEIACNLELRIGKSDAGVTTSDFINFYCDLTSDGYSHMLRMMEPFCDPKNEEAYQFTSHQWLYDPTNDAIDLLFSPGGSW